MTAAAVEAAIGGRVQVNVPASTNVGLVQGLPPTLAVAPETNPLPSKVIGPPPPNGPAMGVALVKVGAALEV